jgi:hypothetical protein
MTVAICLCPTVFLVVLAMAADKLESWFERWDYERRHEDRAAECTVVSSVTLITRSRIDEKSDIPRRPIHVATLRNRRTGAVRQRREVQW